MQRILNKAHQTGRSTMISRLHWSVIAMFLTATASLVNAQQPAKVAKIGYVATTGTATNDGSFAALREGLRDLGYHDGKNIFFDYRSADGKPERIPTFIAELLQLKTDLLFCPNLPCINAAMDATKTIPIVMVSNVDPVQLGIVESFARPGVTLRV
jgi:putative tryptophan/tyrosine transport system substrate-binding protein